MNVYVQGFSALAHYRSSSAKLEVERCPANIRALADATSSRREISEMRIWRLGIGEPSAERPLEVLVHSKNERSRSEAVTAKVWKGPIAPTGFRQISDGIYVSSPEFVFLQLATKLELPELVALGMELCGTYRRNVEVASLYPNTHGYITEYHQPPLTTLKRLKGFLGSMKAAPGSLRALKALDYVLPNSASPMETALYLLLCLPRRLGGYALPKPVLNPPIVLTKAGRKHTIRSSAKPDLFWKDVKLDLEFNSDEFHDENDRTDDSMRRKALERMRVEVIELTSAELFDTRLFHATVLRIALRLKKQLRPEGEGLFEERRSLLRRQLLVDSDTVSTESPYDNAVTREEVELDEERQMDEVDPLVWADTSSSWYQEGAGDESWADDFTDSDASWSADVLEWGDEDLSVF